MTIIEYKNANDMIIKFENGYMVKCAYKEFSKGVVKFPYDKTIYDIGYVGEGKYKISEGRKLTIQYKYWNSMIHRCYVEKYQKKKPTYKECEVCEEWHNFQNFAKWFDENYYKIGEDVMQLDKDILQKGNKIYSPETCVFVPNRINTLFTKRQNDRGHYPIGVTYRPKINKFESRCNCMDKRINLGVFKTPEEAFSAYKQFKEKYIKDVAEEYKDNIPQKLYEAMYRYKVEITD